MTAEIVSDAGHVDRLLPALLNGTLAPGERDEALQHLDRCAACRTELAAWDAIRTATRAYSDIALPTTGARPPGAPRRRLASSSRETGMTSFSSVPIPSRPLLDVPRLPALPGKPARRAWPLAQLATAALLLLTLAASYVALPRGPLSVDRPPTAGILTGVAPATPAPSATADGITPLMQATVDRMPNNPTVVGVARTIYQPGAADATGSAGGLVLIDVERGEIGIAADGPILVGKAAKPSGTIDPPVPARNPSLGPGRWAAVPAGVSYSIRNVGLTDAAVLATFIVSEANSLSGAPDASGTSGNLLGTLSGDDMPPAPVTISVGRTTLAPGASLPAVPADTRRLVVAETGNGVGMGLDGSARNLTKASLVVDVVTIAPAGAAGTPAP